MASLVQSAVQAITTLADRFGFRTVQDWLHSPASYEKTVRYFDARSLIPGLRLMVGLCALLLGSLPGAMLFSPHGPATTLDRAIAIGVIVFALGWTARWWIGPMLSARTSVAFVLSSDVGICLASYTIPNRLIGLMGLAAFFLVAVYVAFFHSLRMLEIHGVLVFIAFAPFAVWIHEDYGWAVTIATGLANPLLILIIPVAIQIGVWTLSEDATVSGFDLLTGLPNRRGFNLRAQLLVEYALKHRVDGLTLAVMLADLDHFKAINDSSGHFIGDEVLRETAKRIEQAAGIASTVGRIGGEEFAIVVLTPDDHLVDTAEEIRRSVAGISGIEGLRQNVSISIGVAHTLASNLQHRNSADISRMLKMADRALYEAKAAGRNRIAIATPAA